MRLLPLLAVACVSVTPSGDPLAPARVTATGSGPTLSLPEPSPAKGPREPAGAPSGPQGDFDFDAEDRVEELPPGDLEQDPLALQARLLGLDEVPPAPAPAPAPATPAPQAPMWDPSYPLPDSSFGVRVLAVLLDMQPPRAVLGLPDGREQVVTPGAMLPSEGLVVLAIGRDAVQVAKITPAGFYARVDTQTVRALYPQSTTAP